MNNSNFDLLKDALGHMPSVAILRGIQPNEIEDIGRVLIDEGF